MGYTKRKSLKVLGNILELCDMFRVLLLALWVPREYNELADFLSHLSFTCNRQQINGSGAQLENIIILKGHNGYCY